MVEMSKLILSVTPELKACLDSLVTGSTVPENTLAELVERLLREHPDVEKVRKSLNVKFTARKQVGRPPKRK